MESTKQDEKLRTHMSGLYSGDALKLLARLPESCVRLLLTDPPYNISRPNNFKSMGREGIDFKWDGGFDQEAWIALAAPAVMPGGSIVIWNDWKNLGQVARALEANNFTVKCDLVWSKTNPKPANIKRRFVQAREYAIWAVKNGPKNTKWVFNKRPEMPYERGEFRYPVQRSPHPTKKPDGLFKEIIEILSNPGDLVLDPFAGGGTTAYASEVLSRLHISFELDPAYYDLAVQHFWKAREEKRNGQHERSNEGRERGSNRNYTSNCDEST